MCLPSLFNLNSVIRLLLSPRIVCIGTTKISFHFGYQRSTCYDRCTRITQLCCGWSVVSSSTHQYVVCVCLNMWWNYLHPQPLLQPSPQRRSTGTTSTDEKDAMMSLASSLRLDGSPDKRATAKLPLEVRHLSTLPTVQLAVEVVRSIVQYLTPQSH